MRRFFEFFWPVLGACAVIFSSWLLYNQLRWLSAADLAASFEAIPLSRYFLAACSALVAYAALSWYDGIAALHVGCKLPRWFVALTSFTAYALSHNIGASVVSGGMIRYRAYSRKSLPVNEIAAIIAFGAFTFILGMVLVGGLILIVQPDIVVRLFGEKVGVAPFAGAFLVGLVFLYAAGSLFRFRQLRIRGATLAYPRIGVTLRQLCVGPVELIGAAGIVYFALPAPYNPGFLTVLGVFIAAFGAGLASHSPGGLGVLELVFLKALPEAPAADLLAALIVFRVFYLLAPLIFAIGVVLVFERRSLSGALRRLVKGGGPP